MNRKLAPTGITLRQVQVLATLSLFGERSQVDLSEDLRVEPSTVVRVLDRMERDGWVERHPAPDDRRKKLIRTTDKVKPTWNKIINLGEEVRDLATAGFSEEELETLKSLLGRIQENLDAVEQDDA
ncbi:MarR family winged helix-turn-helix transcriptional regulator [Saltatorellus ferox]